MSDPKANYLPPPLRCGHGFVVPCPKCAEEWMAAHCPSCGAFLDEAKSCFACDFNARQAELIAAAAERDALRARLAAAEAVCEAAHYVLPSEKARWTNEDRELAAALTAWHATKERP